MNTPVMTLKKIRGFTIVELMVGLTLAMLLTLGIGNIYVETRKTFRAQTALARMVEDGKYAMSTIQRMAYQAGYLNTSKMKSNHTIFSAGYGMGNGLVLSGDAGSLSVRFFGDADGNVISCAQDASGNSSYPAVTENRQYGYKLYREGNQLICASLSSAGATANPQVLADQIVDFKLIYGVDSDGDRLADTYTAVPANWANVFSIRACLVVKTKENNIANSATGKSYLNCDFPGHQQQTVADNDGHLYRTFSNTIYLRNKVN
jgi:type IV pilus assembly protein PilW